MERLNILKEQLEIMLNSSDHELQVQANEWLVEWRQSEFPMNDALALLSITVDPQILTLSLTIISGIMRSSSKWTVGHGEIFQCFTEFVQHHKKDKGLLKYALICLADLAIVSEDFSISTVCGMFEEEDLQMRALIIFYEDAYQYHGNRVTDEEFALGFGVLQERQCDDEWLLLFAALTRVARDVEVFIPLIPRSMNCLTGTASVFRLIQIIGELLELDPGGDIHGHVFEFVGQLSEALRGKFEETGDSKILKLLGNLWTVAMCVQDESLTFLSDKWVKMMEWVYDECFRGLYLMLEHFDEVDEWTNTDWMLLVSSLMGMCEFFGEDAANTSHPLEWFVGRTLVFIVDAMGCGFVFVRDVSNSIGLLYSQSPRTVGPYLTQLYEDRAPVLLTLVSLMTGKKDSPNSWRIPKELVIACAANIRDFIDHCEPEIILDVALAGALSSLELLPEMLSLMLSLFTVHADMTVPFLCHLVEQRHAILGANAEAAIVSPVIEAISSMSPRSLYCTIIMLCNLAVDSNSEMLELLLHGIWQALHILFSDPANYQAVYVQVVGDLTKQLGQDSQTQGFVRKVLQWLTQLGPIWVDEDTAMQGSLAMTMARGLELHLCDEKTAEFVATWINTMITRVEASEYLLCLPWLTDYWPLQNVSDFLLSVREAPNNEHILAILVECFRIMLLNTCGIDTWCYLPIELFTDCFKTRNPKECLKKRICK